MIKKDNILRGECMILCDDSLATARLFRLLFSDDPQSLPQCTFGFVYQCRGGTWRHVPQMEAERTNLEIYKGSELFKRLKSYEVHK